MDLKLEISLKNWCKISVQPFLGGGGGGGGAEGVSTFDLKNFHVIFLTQVMNILTSASYFMLQAGDRVSNYLQSSTFFAYFVF